MYQTTKVIVRDHMLQKLLIEVDDDNAKTIEVLQERPSTVEEENLYYGGHGWKLQNAFTK